MARLGPEQVGGSDTEPRDGETRFADPTPAFSDAGLAFIGRVASPHRERAACPKNRRQALEHGGGGALHIAGRYRPALRGLEAGAAIFVLTFFHQSRRDLAMQTPRHADAPRGTFSLRSPVRPNPVGLHLAIVTALDIESGHVGLDAIDALDGTPVIDLKPYFAGVDRPDPPEPPPDAKA